MKLINHKIFKTITALSIGLIACITASSEAFACTAVYVGSKVSTDGAIIYGKSNDYQDVMGNRMVITERVENTPGRKMPVDNGQTVFAEIPATTYRYTSTPFFEEVSVNMKIGKDATVCANECGVSMEMSITSFSNEAVLKADPLIETGLTEFTAVDLVICQSDTARKAVEVLAGIIEKYGSSEVNIALISDQKETWYFEMYSGHQYAAVKLPDDKVCVFGNEFLLEYLSDYSESVTSPDLEQLAKDNGFAVYGRENELNILATYSGPEVVTNYSHMRTWIGHKLLAPSSIGDYDINAIYPLVYSPDKKVSLQDVMEVLRNRYEGTPYSPDETGRTDMRVIGTDTALSVHIMQVYPNLPADISCVTWESTGPAIYGVFLPLSNGALSVSEPYNLDQKIDKAGVMDIEKYPYYRIKMLTTLCVEKATYEIYGKPVRAYWHNAETGMISGMKKVLENANAMEDRGQAKKYITEYCNAMQNKAFEDAGGLLNEVMFYMSQNSNTLKNGRNPETHDITDEEERIEPLKVILDGSAYSKVPDVPEQYSGGKVDASSVPILVIGAVVVLAIIIAAIRD